MKVYSLFHGTEKGNDKGQQFPHKREEEDLGKSVSLLDKNQEERRNQRRLRDRSLSSQRIPDVETGRHLVRLVSSFPLPLVFNFFKDLTFY